LRSFVLIKKDSIYLFVDKEKLTTEVKKSLVKDNILIESYNEITTFLPNITNTSSVIVDCNTLNYKLFKTIYNGCIVVEKPSIITQLKAIKDPFEIEHYKDAQIQDGIAMCKLFHWLEKNIGSKKITETDVADKSEEFRSQNNNYIGLSFNVISAYKENAALPHYSPKPEKPVYLKPEGMFLIDSGAQYLNGTTDITRTIALGEVNDEQKMDFTLVLKGHIRLAMAKFPKETKGFHLDTLARLDLWQHGKDFGHGTGHGIGYFLNVHEGPHGFSQAQSGPATTIFEPGMLVTNEPGFYLEGSHGIRIENVMACIEDNPKAKNNFLRFETLTFCPIDKKLINIAMLSHIEINWLNNYHKLVYNNLSKQIDGELLNWLKESTLPLKQQN